MDEEQGWLLGEFDPELDLGLGLLDLEEPAQGWLGRSSVVGLLVELEDLEILSRHLLDKLNFIELEKLLALLLVRGGGLGLGDVVSVNLVTLLLLLLLD